MVARQAVDGRRAETLEKLLEAGAEELRAVGHEALTVRSVAARAGVTAAESSGASASWVAIPRVVARSRSRAPEPAASGRPESR